MSQAKAILNDYRQSPRKVRLIADLVRGKKVEEALSVLSFMPKRASLPIKKLIESAVANAKNLEIPTDNLIIKGITVDGGKILYRRLPMSRGRAFTMRKRTSHVNIVLDEGVESKKKIKKEKIVEDKKEIKTAKPKKAVINK